MDTLNELSVAFIWLIRGSVGLRVVYCLYKKMGKDEEASSYMKKIQNAVVFYIFAESAFQLKNIAIFYFKYGGQGVM